MQFLLLLRPRLLGIKNSLIKRRRSGKHSQRETIFALVSAILFVFVYQSSLATFTSVKEHAELFNLPPEVPIALFFSLLGGMVFLSGSTAALGAFYLGYDLDFLISKPVSSIQFLIGKGLETTFQSSWMVLVFGLPTLIGIGSVYHMPLTYHLVAMLALIPVLTIPTSLGIATVSVVIRFISPQKTREILFAAASILILYIYLTAKNFLVTNPNGAPSEISNSMYRLIVFSSSSLLPSSWAATIVGDFLREPVLTSSILNQLALLYTVAFFAGLLAFAALKYLHFNAFSNTRSNSLSTKIFNEHGHERLSRTLAFLPAPLRALWIKEMRLFGRDLTQGLQLVMLLGVCLIYLYNFRIIHQVGELRAEVMLWWRGTLLICNIAMGSFIITAVSSRFVFPSLSLEGNAFWVIRAAPLSLRSILRAKFLIWYLPIGFISSVVLVSGALAIDAEPIVVVTTGIISWFLCFGLVSLGIGLGSIFAHFDWENVPQVSSSFGNFIYMVAGTILVFLNLIPIAVVTVLSIIQQSGVSIATTHWYFALVSAALMLFYLNYATYRFSLRIGEEALLRKT